jgi:hypothetical protein
LVAIEHPAAIDLHISYEREESENQIISHFEVLCRTAQRPAVVSAVDQDAPAEIRPDSGWGGRACSVPLAAE